MVYFYQSTMQKREKQLRLFIALTLSSQVHTELGSFMRALLPTAGNSIRWVDPANIHLTLKFLGEVEPAKLKQLSDEVRQNASASIPFEFSVCGTGVFPAWNHPRILWAGVEAPPGLISLQSQIDLSTRAIGFPSEARAFSPHLTLGRVNEWSTPSQLSALRLKMDQAKELVFGTVLATQVTIFQSTLRPSGPVYTPAAVHNFSTPAG